MIKKTVYYTDFNGDRQERTLYFHASKNELIDNLDLLDQLQDAQAIFEDQKRELEIPEVQKIIALIRRLMRISYGERSADGQNFRKNEEIWESFVTSAAYDQALFEMFQNPDEALEFMQGIMPADLAAEALAEIEGKPSSDSRPVPQDRLPKQVSEEKSLTMFDDFDHQRGALEYDPDGSQQEAPEHDPNGPSKEDIEAQIKKLREQLEQ